MSQQNGLASKIHRFMVWIVLLPAIAQIRNADDKTWPFLPIIPEVPIGVSPMFCFMA